jgi:putative endonuclease
MKAGYVYIMASARNGTLYIGVTSDLVKRVWEHRNGVVSGFTRKYKCRLLVWYAIYDDLEEARRRELQMKKWKRLWKLSEIEQLNPQWRDLYSDLIEGSVWSPSGPLPSQGHKA